MRLLLIPFAALVLLACSGDEPSANPQDATNNAAAVSGGGVVFRFASPAEGAAVLTAEDAYSRQTQPRELGIRAGDAAVTTFDALAPIYAADVQTWPADEREALTQALGEVMAKVDAVDHHLPSEVLLIKAGTVVEGGLPHTRANAIVFAGNLPSGTPLKALLLHELHHVLSRANPDRLDDYYRVIGFEPCRLVEPEALRDIRLTNPDAPSYAHVAPVVRDEFDGVVPYLYANRAFDGRGTLGEYFGFGLMPVRLEGGRCTPLADGPEDLLNPQLVPGFGALIGTNTDYIIHPEEVLADNFVYWALEREGLPNPDIPQAVGRFWQRD